MTLTWKKKYTTVINTNIFSDYEDKHIQNPLAGKKKLYYHAVSKSTAGMRVKLVKKDPNVQKKKKRSEIHSIDSLECIE